MKKTIFGIALLAVLIIIMTTKMVIDNRSEATTTNVIDVTGDTSVTGGMIAPVESVGIQPGEVGPPFEMETLDGEIIKFDDLKGKKIMLNFWASWCPPCKEEMPEIQSFYEDYKDDIEIVVVNSKEKDEKVIEFINEYGYTFPIPLDRDGTVTQTYGVITLPTTYFIGSDGKILEPRHVGPMTYDFMEEMLNKLN